MIIKRSLEEVDSNPHECLWGEELRTFVEEVPADVVERARELEIEVEPEEGTELLKSVEQTWADEHLFLMDEWR